MESIPTIAYLVSYAPMHAYYSVHVMSLHGPILGIQLQLY